MTVPELTVSTAGTHVRVRSELSATLADLSAASGEAPRAGSDPVGTQQPQPDVTVTVERSRRPFSTAGMQPLTRGAWTDDQGRVVLASAGGSGWTQSWHLADRLSVVSRWTPSPAERGASLLLPARRRALEAQVLLHHPALWAAARRGLAPLHASVLEVAGLVVVLAGPGGLGKSTLVAEELASGARVCSDNVVASDGRTAWGLAEPLRLHSAPDGRPGTTTSPGAEPSPGSRTTHGRREFAWSGRVESLVPDVVVVVARGAGPVRLSGIAPERAARALVAGTLAAGELLRLWPLSAVLGLATGHGPVMPDVEGVAHQLVSGRPCLELRLGPRPRPPLHALLAGARPSLEGANP